MPAGENGMREKERERGMEGGGEEKGAHPSVEILLPR